MVQNQILRWMLERGNTSYTLVCFHPCISVGLEQRIFLGVSPALSKGLD